MIVLSLMHTCWRFVSPIEEKYLREHTSTAQDVPQNRWFNKKNRWLHWTAYMYIKKILISVQWSFHRIRASVHSAMVLIEVWIIFLYTFHVYRLVLWSWSSSGAHDGSPSRTGSGSHHREEAATRDGHLLQVLLQYRDDQRTLQQPTLQSTK